MPLKRCTSVARSEVPRQRSTEEPASVTWPDGMIMTKEIGEDLGKARRKAVSKLRTGRRGQWATLA
jgi:hypothetical protein